jgi:hypothetical protein
VRHQHPYRCCAFLAFAVVALLSPFLAGCDPFKVAAVEPGQDPLVVNAERMAAASLSAFDAVTKYDHENLEFMKSKLPAVHEKVQTLRREFPPQYRALRDATKLYKATRDQANADEMNKLLRQVQEKGTQAQEILGAATKAKAASPQDADTGEVRRSAEGPMPE